MRYRFVFSLLCLLSFAFRTNAAETEQPFRVSLITCYPGSVVYELYGHAAIRIQQGNTDKIYNFGMFSFNKPNFLFRFVKGETDYALGSYPFVYFIPEYTARNSKVVEQVLNLNQQQAEQLYRRLEHLSLPENREYRYNYVFDNCATRPRDMIEQAVGNISYPTPSDTTLTFRRIMRSYSSHYPWYQFGIDLALGSGIDYRLNEREQMFAPIYLMTAFQKATFANESGHQEALVSETNILFNGSESPVLPPTPWYLTPLFLSLLLLAAAILLTWVDIRRQKTSRWFDCIWFTLCGLAGSLLFFLIFVSVHEATSPNYLAWWLNPFCFIAAIGIWTKKAGKCLYLYHFINFAIVLVLLATWWLNPQCANAAFFPLMLCSVIRSANYIVVYQKCKKRNNRPTA